jgi:hypothetical protein
MASRVEEVPAGALRLPVVHLPRIFIRKEPKTVRRADNLFLKAEETFFT